MKITTGLNSKPFDVRLIEFISEGAQNEQESWTRKRMYASDAAFCARKNKLSSVNQVMEDVNYSTDIYSELYMNMGLAIEKVLIKSLKNKGILLSENYKLKNSPHTPLNVGGKVDLVYEFEDDIWISEVKSCGKLKSKPEKNHLAQLATYCLLGGFRKANLIYVSRNVKDYRNNELLARVFEFDTSNKNLMSYGMAIAGSHLAIKDNWLPDIPSNFRKTTTCRFCNFSKYCWENEELPVEIPFSPSEKRQEVIDTANSMVNKLYDLQPVLFRENLQKAYLEASNNSKTKNIISKYI